LVGGHEAVVVTGGGGLAEDFFEGGLAHLLTEVRVVPEEADFVGEVEGVAGLEEEASEAIFDDFGDSADVGADDRFGVEHGFDDDGGEAFIPNAGEDEESHGMVELVEAGRVEVALGVEIWWTKWGEVGWGGDGAGGVEGDIGADLSGGGEGSDAFFFGEAAAEGDVGAKGPWGGVRLGARHIGDDDELVASEAGGDEFVLLEGGLGDVDGNVVGEGVAEAGGVVTEGIAQGFEDIAFAVFEDAPVFAVGDAFFADAAVGEQKA